MGLFCFCNGMSIMKIVLHSTNIKQRKYASQPLLVHSKIVWANLLCYFNICRILVVDDLSDTGLQSLMKCILFFFVL